MVRELLASNKRLLLKTRPKALTLFLQETNRQGNNMVAGSWKDNVKDGTVVVSQDDGVIVLYQPSRKLGKAKRVAVPPNRAATSEKERSTAMTPPRRYEVEEPTIPDLAKGRPKKPQRFSDTELTDLESRRYPKRLSDLGRSGITDSTFEGSDCANSSEVAGTSCDMVENNICVVDTEAKTHVQRKVSTIPVPLSCGYHVTHRIRMFIKELMRFKALKISQILLSVYIMVLTFADIGPPGGLRDSETGFIIDENSPEGTEEGLILLHGDERAIIATSTFQVGCIGLARLSAWFMYPSKFDIQSFFCSGPSILLTTWLTTPALVFVFISKFRGTTCFLSKSPLAMHMYSDSHELHVYCGWTIVVCAFIHTACHLARWAAQGNMDLLVTHCSGITGLLIVLSCILICIPMTFLRETIKYEVRKNLHYFFILFAAALAFHTPRSAVPNGGFTAYVFGGLLVWYFLDATYCYFFMTEKIDTTKFSVLPSGVRMTMNVSKRFQKAGAQGGICYVCLPWIAKNQWHAFSLFENPSNPAERQIFIQKTGDWTTKLHRYVQRDTVRPAWVHGPFPSPYDNADAYDNQILVASGIGITPALSVIRAHKDSRRINLIWAVRDHHLLKFFFQHLYLDHEGWNLIYYTGKEKLRMPDMNLLTNTNVCIIEGRPKLHEVIPNIIFGIESRQGLPENYTRNTRAVASELLADRLIDFNNSSENPTGVDAAAEDLACYASELGFHLPTEELSQNFDLFTPNRNLERSRTSKELMSHLSIGFRPWDKCDGAKEYVKKLDPNIVLPTWGMLYCGGAKMVLKDLEKISEDYGIGLHIESFKW